MATITLSAEEKEALTHKLQKYLDKELDIELGQFDAEFLLEFFSENMGGYFYNRGLLDAHAIFDLKMDDVKDALYEAEMPTSILR
jgi:uncharacterized protein (DUF2164 family)